MVRVVATPDVFRQVNWQPIPRELREREYVSRPLPRRKRQPLVNVVPPPPKPEPFEGGERLI